MDWGDLFIAIAAAVLGGAITFFIERWRQGKQKAERWDNHLQTEGTRIINNADEIYRIRSNQGTKPSRNKDKKCDELRNEMLTSLGALRVIAPDTLSTAMQTLVLTLIMTENNGTTATKFSTIARSEAQRALQEHLTSK